jgi:hypothetical protein
MSKRGFIPLRFPTKEWNAFIVIEEGNTLQALCPDASGHHYEKI